MNLGVALDVAARVRGDEFALSQAGRRITWRDFERRARNIAGHLLADGLTEQGKVAIYTYNHAAYNEAVYACFKARGVAVNVNYRYREEELQYLLGNADAEAIVVHEHFIDTLENVLAYLPKLKTILVVNVTGGAAHEALPGALDYETVAEEAAPDDLTWPEPSPDDLMFLYTGGTTGMPKGVMWRQGDLYDKLGGGGLQPSPETPEGLTEWLGSNPAMRTLVGVPLMHGTGWFTALIALLTGGEVILLDNPEHFDPADFWGIIERDKPMAATIVGDTFARPLLRELDQGGREYDLSSLFIMTSSGVMWSEETKQGLLSHNPSMMLIDAFSSSEALGMGQSITTAAGTVHTGKFALSDTTRLFSEDLEPLETAPGVEGLVGVGGGQPVGYYKDPDKTAATFVEAEGDRYSIPGDWAVVDEDGVTLTLLGRGSVCINTGGEKVFAEEVEEVLKRHADVRDVTVVGLDDDKWGQAITGVVSTFSGDHTDEHAEALIGHVKEHLAGYKAPKHIVFVDDVYRSPSGKADYKASRAAATEALGIS